VYDVFRIKDVVVAFKVDAMDDASDDTRDGDNTSFCCCGTEATLVLIEGATEDTRDDSRDGVCGGALRFDEDRGVGAVLETICTYAPGFTITCGAPLLLLLLL